MTNTLAQFDGTKMVPSPGFVLPVTPATKTLHQYQVASVEQIMTYRRVILGLQPGLGKTVIIQAVAAIEAASGRKTLIIVPPALRVDPWAQEFAKDFPSVKVILATGTKQHDLPECDVLIMSDSLVASRVDDIVAWSPDNLMCDEAHRLKSPDSKRTKSMHAIAEVMHDDAIIVMATGTISVNNAGDVYNPLFITSPDHAATLSGTSTWTQFLDVWCETEIAWRKRVVVGCKDVHLLRKRLIQICMINIDRDLVLDLPDRTFITKQLELGHAEYSKYMYVMKNFLDWMLAEFGKEAAERSGKAEAMTRMMRLWEVDGQVRAKVSAEYIHNLIVQDEQVVVMAHHASVIDAIRDDLIKRGWNVATIRGGMSSEKKAQVVTDFQAGKLNVIVGQVEAAGVGLTLTAARHIVFAQLPWSPAVFAQACDRIYRIGQVRKTFVHVLMGSHKMMSQRVWGRLGSKSEITDAINSSKPVTMTSKTSTQSLAQEVFADFESEIYSADNFALAR